MIMPNPDVSGGPSKAYAPMPAVPRPNQLYAQDAERAVLACMLNFPSECVEAASKRLARNDFFVPFHQHVFGVLCAMFRDQEPIDLLSLRQRLLDLRLLEQDELGVLVDLSAAPATAVYVQKYANQVAEKALLRRLFDFTEEVRDDIATWTDSVASVLDRAEERIRRVLRSDDGQSVWRPADLFMFMEEQRVRPEPVQIVEHFIEAGTKVCFGGASKSKKTWSMLDLALSVAFGKTFWGMTTSRVKVLHLDFELQPKKLHNRIEAICRARGITIEPGWFFTLCLRGQMSDPVQMLQRIRDKAKEVGALLIIIDPAYKFIAGKDENAAGDIAELMNQIEGVVVETGAAVIIANHFSKGNQAAKDPIDRIAGSGVWARDADTMFVMTAHEEDDALTVSPVVRNFKEIPEFVVRWNYPLMERADDLDPKALRQPKVHNSGDAKRNAEELLELLDDGPLRYGQFMHKAEEDLGVKENTFKKYFRLLKEAKKIDSFGGMWRATR